MVTRFRSCPRLSSACAVRSESTTTWYSFPPAATSRAVVVAISFSRTRDATMPFTLDRSKFLSGSLKRKSSAAHHTHGDFRMYCVSVRQELGSRKRLSAPLQVGTPL